MPVKSLSGDARLLKEIELTPASAPGYDQTLVEELKDKEFRDSFVSEHVRTGIAYQITGLREEAGWSQSELGRRAGKPQNVISRLEDPEYGRPTIQTLLEIASAFDVALLVRFVPFSELLERTQDVTTAALRVPSFSKDTFVKTSAPVSHQLVFDHQGPFSGFGTHRKTWGFLTGPSATCETESISSENEPNYFMMGHDLPYQGARTGSRFGKVILDGVNG